MFNTKVVILLLALSVVVVAIAGIAFVQYASAQANLTAGGVGQLTPDGYNSGYQMFQQGHSPHCGSHQGSPNERGYGMGMGMRGSFW